MLKALLISATIALSGAAQAEEPSIVLPEGVTCSNLFWYQNGRVNPTELNDYQKCILAVNYGETDSGSLGDLLWVRINGEYFSVSKRKLWSSFSKEEDAQRALQIEFIRQHKEWKQNETR